MPGSILFDLDGVLADSRRPIIDCVNEALEALGLARKTDEEIVPMIGPPTEIGFAMVLDVAPEDPLVDDLVRGYRARYATELMTTPSYPGVPDTVRQLGQDHLLGVATSKPRRFALPTLEAIGLATEFAYVAGPEPDGPNDKLSMVTEAAKALPDAQVMVGDRSFDMLAAKELGLTAIGVTWGFGTREELEEAGADELVDSAAELAQAVLARASTS